MANVPPASAVVNRYAGRVRFDVLEEHLEEVDFLFAQRALLLTSQRHTLSDLDASEQRLLAHLDGLLAGEAEAYKLLLPKFVQGEGGEVFAVAYTVLATADAAWLELLARMYFDNAQGPVLDGLCAALRLVPHSANVTAVVAPWFTAARAPLRAAALDVLGFRRDPAVMPLVRALLDDPEPAVRAAACVAAGQLRDYSLRERVERELSASDDALRRAALRSAMLLGSTLVLDQCRAAVQRHAAEADEADEALRLLGYAGQAVDLPRVLAALSEETLVSAALAALGWMGNVAAIETLLDYAGHPQHLFQVAQSFQRITGVDFGAEQLLSASSAAPAAQADSARGGASADETALPNPDKLAVWWSAHAAQFPAEQRLLHGQPFTLGGMLLLLEQAALAQRGEIALALALMDAALPHIESTAFAVVQRTQCAACGV